MRFKDDVQKWIYYTGQIDYCYYRIKSLSDKLNEPKTGLEYAIDKATGFEKHLINEIKTEIKYLSGVIIRCKKKLGHDTKTDQELLAAIKRL